MKGLGKQKKEKEFNRLNLIPILDSVFIFIFFLLMSAQFLKYSQINAEVPLVKDGVAPKENNEEPKKNIVVSINNNNRLIIKAGNKLILNEDFNDREKISQLYLTHMMANHTKYENYIKFSGSDNVQYSKLVEAIDLINQINITEDLTQKRIMITAMD
jgi:biopolymer transport protein ExbD